MRRPLIVHIHVPKTAGSSFRTLLQERFGSDHANLYVDDTYFVYGESYLEEFVSGRPSLCSISSHFIRTFPPRIAGRTVLYVTFLRHPVERFISYLTYARKYFHEIPDVGLLACLPPRAPELPLREMANWVLSRDVPFSENENYQVNFFARYHFRNIHSEDDDELYRASRLLLAKTHLQQFFFTGIAERMDESCERLAQLGNDLDIEMPHGPVGVENVSNEYRDDLEWINASDEVGARLLASMAEDQKLYEWSLARFERTRAEKVGPTDRSIPIGRRPPAPPLLTQLFWRSANQDFSESQSVQQHWVVGSDDAPYRLKLPRFDRVPVQFRLDLTDRPIILRVSRISLLNESGVEVWRMRLQTPPGQLCMAGITLIANASTGGILARIEDSDPMLLLPVEADALARLNMGGAIEIVMSAV